MREGGEIDKKSLLAKIHYMTLRYYGSACQLFECSQLTSSSSGSGTEGNEGGSLSGGKSNASLEGLEPALPFCGSAGHESSGGSTGDIVCVFEVLIVVPDEYSLSISEIE